MKAQSYEYISSRVVNGVVVEFDQYFRWSADWNCCELYAGHSVHGQCNYKHRQIWPLHYACHRSLPIIEQGTILKQCRHFFQIFDILHVSRFLVLSFGNFDHFLTPEHWSGLLDTVQKITQSRPTHTKTRGSGYPVDPSE